MRVASLMSLSLMACSGSVTSPAQPDQPDASDNGIAGLSAIAIQPADVTITLEGDTPATQVFSARGTFMDGHTEDVTQRVGWTWDNFGLGQMTGATFTSYTSMGGKTRVLAHAGAVTGVTSLTVVIHKQFIDPVSTGLPPNPGSLFGGPPGPDARKPVLVYPNDGVLVPPNLGQLEFHFMPGAQNTVFELSFANSITDVKVYLTCATPLNGGCIYKPASAVWTSIAGTNRGDAPVTFAIKGTSDGSAVSASASQSLSFAEDDVRGAIYYWTTSGTSAIMRFDFAGTQTSGQAFITGNGIPNNPDACIGCHSLSRDGSKLIAERGATFRSELFVYDVKTKAALATPDTTQRSWFESWNPDGSQYVGVCGADVPAGGCSSANLLLIDGTKGTLLGTIDVGAKLGVDPVDHPDWSADGKSIAYMRPGVAPSSLQTPAFGAIEMVTNHGGSWSSPITVIPRTAGKNRYYPAFSPDNAFIVFDESTCPAGKNSDKLCDADSDPSARLFIVPAEAQGSPIALARANTGGVEDGTTTDLTNSFPKWSPFLYRRTGDKKLLWLTFSSTRNYGLRPTPPPFDTSHNPKGSLIWMVAIDPDAAHQGMDPSYPPFALPFQDTTTSNHIAQWTSLLPIIP